VANPATSGENSIPAVLEAAGALSAATELRRWWQTAHASDAYQERFELIRTFNAPTESIGFFGESVINGRRVPVMGTIEDRLFDRAKSSDIGRFCKGLREFVFRYLMRVSDFRRPAMYMQPKRSPPKPLRRLSWCPDDKGEFGRFGGFGYSQHWYKLSGTDETGRFPPEQAYAIVDLRELGRAYEWVVARVRIFEFSFSLRPFGAGRAQVVVPLEEWSYIVLSPEFIVDENVPSADEDGRTVIGRYGFGYAFIKNPEGELVGYGPGQFDVAFQQFVFRVYENGEVRVQLAFASNRPQRIATLPFAPFDWGFGIADALSLGLASPLFDPVRRSVNRIPFRFGSFDPISIAVALVNLLTAGQADRQLCISREQLEKEFLVKHFERHYEMISGALQTWREMPDWTDSAALPDWVRTGVTA
jgi:hypothetical protein